MNGGGNEGQADVERKTAAVAPMLGTAGRAEENKNKVVLYLCQFKDITPLKEPLEGENNKSEWVWWKLLNREKFI